MTRSVVKLQSGQTALYLLIGIVVLVGGALVFGTQSRKTTQGGTSSSAGIPTQTNTYTCCDSGSGENCHPISSQSLTFDGNTYGLLKTAIHAQEAHKHLSPTTLHAPDGGVIWVNTTNIKPPHTEFPKCTAGKDFIVGNKECLGIDNDLLIYVCRSSDKECNTPFDPTDFNNDNERDEVMVYDVYARTTPGKDNTLPDSIRYCQTQGPKPTSKPGGVVIRTKPSSGDKKTLQVDSFTIQQNVDMVIPLSPWCKPAIYLYPEQTQPVHVAVSPVGRMKVTIPQYPKTGWDVIAQPNGLISAGGSWYDYLYYEAEIPDSAFSLPKEGYVVAYDDLQIKLPTIVSQFGLNPAETKAFTEYWLKALPKAPYYAIRVLPQTTVDAIAPLTVQPNPASVLRLSLHFTPLITKEQLPEPTIAPFIRKGFTLVEWGGIFKKTPGYAFSCFM